MIPFNRPLHLGSEMSYIEDAIKTKICGDGIYTQKCQSIIQTSFQTQKALLSTSGTAALEMAAMLADIKPGDEVIMPSYTFSSTANAFVRLGASIAFIDIRADTMNIDEKLIEQAVNQHTRAIVPVHYAGVSCEMDTIQSIAKKYKLLVIEDAAQAVMSTYKGAFLGTLGHFGCFSFHETKNYTMGEGGALLIKDASYNEAAEIIREKGTNRAKFYRGQVDKYTWVAEGSSYVPSELCAAYLYSGLSCKEQVNDRRKQLWRRYYEQLQELSESGRIELPEVPEQCEHNAHMFYIKANNLQERSELISYLQERGIMAVFHYVPLHTSPAGRRYGKLIGKDRFTTKESERLLRLPMYYDLSESECDQVVDAVNSFYR